MAEEVSQVMGDQMAHSYLTISANSQAKINPSVLVSLSISGETL